MSLLTQIRFLLASFSVLVSIVNADIIIHVQHPWATEDPIRTTTPFYITSEEPGWYPGKRMTEEGGNWYTYTFVTTTRSSNQRIEFLSVIPNSSDNMAQRLTYPGTGVGTLTMKTIFASNPQANEVWIGIPDPKKPPVIMFSPPPSKVIAFYNPWEIGFPRAEIKDLATVKMRKIPDYCGWFVYNYFATLDRIRVKFVNSVDKSTYTQNGLQQGDYIDLTDLLADSDTVWIYPEPIPDGAPSTSSFFPGITGDCGLVTLAVTLRDKNKDLDFGSNNCDGGSKVTPKMVQPRLGTDGKPIKTAGSCQSDDFDKWFIAEDFGNGYTNEICHNITLEKNELGLYEYDSDAFFPLDNFLYLDEAKTIDNPNHTPDVAADGKSHNFWFTMELGAKFEYVPGQTFYFRGDDDVWVFIDSQLVVDLGGLHSAAAGSVNLDDLGLTPGDTYSFKLFFAERKCCHSNFRIVTSINLRSSSNLFYEKDSSSDITKYIMKEKRTKSNLACDSDGEIVDTANAEVVYYIEGPSFPTPFLLKPGNHFGDSVSGKYGLIIIATKDSSVLKLDTANFVGVLPGDYVINYYSSKDRSQGGRIPFTIYEVPKPPRIPNSVVSAAYYANNPFGQVDRAEIYFRNIPTITPDSIQLFWPSLDNTMRTVYSSELIEDPNNKKHYTISLTNPFPKNITSFLGSNLLGYSYSYDTTFFDPQEIVSIRFADSVGPLLTDAILLERVDAGDDTLLLRFTEGIIDTTFIGKSLILLKEGSPYITNIYSYAIIGDTARVLVSAENGIKPAVGDSLRINGSGPLTDYYGNHARPDNRPVVISVRKSAARILHAFYTDQNADGIVDMAQIEFDRDVDASDLLATFTWMENSTTGLLDKSRIAPGLQGSIVTINLTQAFNKDIANRTSNKMGVTVNFNSFPSIERSSEVYDSAAPVLLSATYAPGVFTSEGISPDDTVIVQFSEDISMIVSDLPLKFKKSGSTTEYIVHLSFLKMAGAEHVFKATAIEGDQYPSRSDSVWINPEGLISDLNSNFQINPFNKRVLLKMRVTPVKFSYKIGPNPFNPLTNNVKIWVDPSVRTREALNITAKVSIYDPYGNRVYRGINSSLLSETTVLKYEWNGTNLSGRRVADGTYLVVIKAEDLNTGFKDTKSIPVGVDKR